MEKGSYYKPSAVTDKERLRFIEMLKDNFPASNRLNEKLNQKICPLPAELLRCMRIDFSEEEGEEDSYEEVGKYDFIIDQEVCNAAIKLFREEDDAKHPTAQAKTQAVDDLTREFPLGERLGRYLRQRENYIANRRNHTKELRWEVLNI